MLNPNATLENAVKTAKDLSVVAELYASDAEPTANGFDPNDALKCYANIAGITFQGVEYTRLVSKFGQVKKNLSAETNTTSIDFSNLSREISQFETSTGFDGLILVIRLLSRSQSVNLDDTFILFTGRCERPTTGNRQSISVTGKHILSSVTTTLPRRKFTPDDAEGRHYLDKLFEGFPFIPQYGNFSYSVRTKKLFFWHKTKIKTIQWSSFSDVDTDASVPEVFGRVQISGMHLAYADTGLLMYVLSVFSEGQIKSFLQFKFDDSRWAINNNSIAKKYGKLGGIDEQINDQPDFIGAGIYSRSAYIRCVLSGTNVETVEAAPSIIAVMLGKMVTVPNNLGEWVNFDWSDNYSPIVRSVLTSPDYFNLSSNWIDDNSFTESLKFNDAIIFDSANSDLLFVPDAQSFQNSLLANTHGYYLPTSSISYKYFKYLKGDIEADETFGQFARSTDDVSSSRIDPIEPHEGPGGGGTGTGSGQTLLFYLRRRYTCNLAVTESLSAIDLLYNVLFPSARLFLTQGQNGKLRLHNKKPVDFALGTATFTQNTNSIAVDDVSPWITDKSQLLLIGPNSAQSEIKTVTNANYSSSQNGIEVTVSTNLSKTNFSGSNGNTTPATATITVDTATEGAYFFEFDGERVDFNTTEDDTEDTIAGFIYATINAHPRLSRKFVASWAAGSENITITARFGNLILDENLLFTHSAPLANPTTAPTASAVSTGSLEAGIYKVAYSYKNLRGETTTSPVVSVTLTANQKISVSGISLPSGATEINWYCSPAKHSTRLRLVKTNNGASFEINSLPTLDATLPRDFNRTGCEVMRVCASFTDRAEPRSGLTRSNVLKATYKWSLNNQEKLYNGVELTFRDATQDYRKITLKLKDKAHIKKTKKYIPLKLEQTAIDNYHHAYRIASGELAEKLDANFFYSWSSDRAALFLEEGDVVCITDDSLQVYNLPCRIEQINYDDLDSGFIKNSFVARKYSTTLFDDSVAERQIPIIGEI